MNHYLLLPLVMLAGALSFVTHASEADKLSLDQLLEQVQQGHQRDQVSNQKRLQAFLNNRSEQQQLLSQLQQERRQAEAVSQQYELQFEQNEQQITLLEQRLTERLGSLKELFGVLQLVANDTQGQFDNSLIQIHYPKRTAWLTAFSDKMGQTTELPTVEEIEGLWFELQREMTESGKLVESSLPVLLQTGQEVQAKVLRVGTFNLIMEGKYIQRLPETGRLVEYPRQPSRRYMAGAQALSEGATDLTPLTIDPIRGQLIALKGTTPDLVDRVHQGGLIGYIIIGLGGLALCMALYRLFRLWIQDRKIQHQMQDLTSPANNALGHIVKVYQEHRHEPLDVLELKLGEAVLREVPVINQGLSFLKITAALAPLLGLLGTVTGMIVTFQAITLFGAGDPKLMAGGISQALVTTVLGLIVAIPTLLLHNFVSDRAKKLTQIIEQESVALVALHAESEQEGGA